MIVAALPPSSSVTCLNRARSRSCQPTSGEPVKLSFLIRSSSTSAPAALDFIGRIENAPSGRSVSARISPSISAPIGVAEAGFNTNGQPQARAGAILWATRLSGKFHGVMNAHGPTGTRFHMPR